MSSGEQFELNFDSKENDPEPVIDMGAFRKDIFELVGKRGIDVEMNMDLNELSIEDAIIWYKIQNYTKGLISPKEYTTYVADVDNSKKIARKVFQAIVGNKLTIKWGNEIMELQRKLREQKNNII